MDGTLNGQRFLGLLQQ